jgi:hypothetical protein
MKQSAVIILFILSLLHITSATELGNVVSQMQPNSWRPIMALGLTGNMTHSGDVMDHIYAYGHNACWDENTEQMLFIGAAHYAPMRFNVYKAETNTWRAESFPPCKSSLGWVSHSYDNLTITPEGDFYHLYRGTLYKFNTLSNSWGSPLPGLGSSRYGSLEHFPEMNALIYTLGGTISKFSLTSKSWSTFKSGVTMGSIHNIAQYSPTHKKMILGGGNGNSALHLMDSQGNLTRTKSAPFSVGLNTSLLTMEPVSGNFLFLTSENLWMYHVKDDRWESLIKNYVPAIGKAAMAPISSYGCVALISVTNYPFLLYKYQDSPLPVNKPAQVNSQAFKILANPNPFHANIKIRLQNTDSKTGKDYNLRIFDVHGKLIYNSKETIRNPQSASVWDASDLSPGIYLISVLHGKTRITKKVTLLK